jgi:hypothetical protein
MGLIVDSNELAGGYEAVSLPVPGGGAPGGAQADGAPGGGVAVLRRRSARPSKRAVVYVHCLGDSFVPPDLAGWYTDRGFHFYAADLRAAGAGLAAVPEGNRAAAELSACFSCLDAAVCHLRSVEAIETLVVSAHAAGALVAALWCHARRGSGPADALILAGPDLGPGRVWGARAGLQDGGSVLLAGAQRRIRRGLEITCPVLVMSPAGEAGRAGRAPSWLPLAGHRLAIRLGEHVTWLTLAGGLPGQEPAIPAQRRRLFDEMGRWLGAYLSGQIRDQLL